MRYPIVLLVVCSLLGACQSSPRKNFYLLTAEPVAAPSSTTIDTLIGVGPIEVAEYLNRLHMVYEVKDGSLVVADNAHWAEPLNEGIARVIGLNLTAQDARRAIFRAAA